MEIIICAAVKTTDGQIVRGHRHSDCFRAIRDRKLKPERCHYSQGFITSKNRFVNRWTAMELQLLAKIKSVCDSGKKPY